MKRIIFIIAFCIPAFLSFAQQDPMYGQYIFNNAIINPAQAGVQDVNQAGILTRRQWLGMDGAPTTNSLFINTRLPRNLGFAGGIYSDRIGPVHEVTVQTDLAVRVQLNETWSFSGGLRAMGSNMTANLTALQTNSGSDPLFNTNFNTGVYLNLGAGVLFFTEKSFIGASMPRLFARTISDGKNTLSRSVTHFSLYGGSSFPVNDDITFTPSVLIKTAARSPMQFDLNFIFDYKDMIDAGPMLRSKDAIGFLVGYKVTPQLYAGYMFEYPINSLNLITSQTHEISLRMLWQSGQKSRVRSPRYFL